MLPNDPNGVAVPHFFIWDEAFPLHRDLLWPFPRNQLSNEAKIYNYRLCRGRRVVENAFGILAQRWCIYQCQIYLGPDMVEFAIKASVVLHNILTVPGDAILNGVVEQCVPIFDHAFEDLANVGNQPGQGPAVVCEYMKDYFNSDYGSVPWQNAAAYVHLK